MAATKPVPRRVRCKSTPAEDHQPAGKSADDVRTQHPELMAKIKAHMDAFKNGDRSEENKAGMKAAMEELQRVKGHGKGGAPVKEPKGTRLYEDSYTPNEGPVPAVPATRKRSPKTGDDEALETDECKPEKKVPRNARDTEDETISDKQEKKLKKKKSAAQEATAEIGDEPQKKKRKNQPPEEVAEDETTNGTKKKKKRACEDDTTPPSTKDRKATHNDVDTSDKTDKTPPVNDRNR